MMQYKIISLLLQAYYFFSPLSVGRIFDFKGSGTCFNFKESILLIIEGLNLTLIDSSFTVSDRFFLSSFMVLF